MTTNTTLTIETRFNLAIQAIQADGVEVILNDNDGITVTADRAATGIVWTDDMPTLVFNDEGDPAVGENGQHVDFTMGKRIEQVTFNHIGDRNVASNSLVKHFRAQGFEVTDVQNAQDGMIVHF